MDLSNLVKKGSLSYSNTIKILFFIILLVLTGESSSGNLFLLNNFSNNTQDDYTSFYFREVEFKITKQRNYNSSNSLLIFRASDGKYHNISLNLNITLGYVKADLIVENCQDYGAGPTTQDEIGNFSYNFVAYEIELKALTPTNRSDPNNYFPYSIEVNGSYFLEDHGPLENSLGDLQYNPNSCQWGLSLEPITIIFGFFGAVVISLVYRKLQ